MAAMIHRGSSPTPDNSHHYNLHDLVDHNNRMSSGRRMYGPDGGLYLATSQASSTFADPARMQQMSPMEDRPFVFHHLNQDSHVGFQGQGLGIQPGNYTANCQDMFPDEGSIFSSLPRLPSNEREATPRSSSSRSTELATRTRSGRNICHSASPSTSPSILKSDTTHSRVAKSPRVKAPRPKSSSTKAPRIDRPLSELTKDMKVKVRDMDAWVHRSYEDRQKEVEKKNGYVSRPMNSFMLYRSAYAERTKTWCLQNNHQVVSAVSGESWPMEPPEIREKYNELARIERDNHAKAHPKYKFSPSKNGPASRRKRGEFSDDEASDRSEVGNGDDEWRPRGERRSHKRHTREQSSSSSFTTTFDDQFFLSRRGLGGGSWELPIEPGAFPNSFTTQSYYNAPYFQQATHRYSSNPYFVNAPMQQHFYGCQEPAFQSAYQLGMSQIVPQQPQQSLDFNTQVDPSLLQLSNGMQTQHEEEDAKYLGYTFETPTLPSDFDEWTG